MREKSVLQACVVVLSKTLGLLAFFPVWVLAQTGPQPKLPQIELRAGLHLIRAELASNDVSRSIGLMFRDKLGNNEGMLFVFEHASRQCFWMRNTRIALSIAFVAEDGKIVNIERMQPFSEQSHCSAEPVRFALEMEQGWFAGRGLAAGSRLRGPEGLFRSR